jgi:hypothetical protein
MASGKTHNLFCHAVPNWRCIDKQNAATGIENRNEKLCV